MSIPEIIMVVNIIISVFLHDCLANINPNGKKIIKYLILSCSNNAIKRQHTHNILFLFQYNVANANSIPALVFLFKSKYSLIPKNISNNNKSSHFSLCGISCSFTFFQTTSDNNKNGTNNQKKYPHIYCPKNRAIIYIT